MADTPITHVSDTALWVAYYRAQESLRPDALFKDPLAEKLVGERGRQIAEHMGSTSKYTRFQVILRTVVIDRFIRELISQGLVDTVVNIGAGLDTRPYRLDLPSSVRWIEADYPHMIELKNTRLASDQPRVELSRVAVDLADANARQAFLRDVGTRSSKILILTEGVLPYLTPAQVGALADDMRAVPSIKFWIAEYFAEEIYKYLDTPERRRAMKNAPFVFFPPDWMGFFAQHGWKPREYGWLGDAAIATGRRPPMPWWAAILSALFPRQSRERIRRQTAYVIYEPIA